MPTGGGESVRALRASWAKWLRIEKGPASRARLVALPHEAARTAFGTCLAAILRGLHLARPPVAPGLIPCSAQPHAQGGSGSGESSDSAHCGFKSLHRHQPPLAQAPTQVRAARAQARDRRGSDLPIPNMPKRQSGVKTAKCRVSQAAWRVHSQNYTTSAALGRPGNLPSRGLLMPPTSPCS